MINRKRLAICYVVPGHNLLASAGPTRNVLYLAEALSQWADVTVAFRRVMEPIVPQGYSVVEIQPGEGVLPPRVDDAAVRGRSLHEFITYLRAVRQFVQKQLHCYDIVLEKSWLLSGYLTSLCRQRGVPAAVVENLVQAWNEPIRTFQDCSRYFRYRLTQTLVRRCLRQAPLIIAETEALKAALAQGYRISTQRIEVVGLGVDHRLFKPRDQASARRELGLPLEANVLIYAGVLDKTHNLTPVLEAMQQSPDRSLQLHIVGDGVRRQFYEAKASGGRRNVFFHGRVPHCGVPRYIAAADLCLAPYDAATFANGEVAYFTLKIPEYMACARPVVSVASGHILRLIQHGVSGFLFRNDVQSWVEFLCRYPAREQLRDMGVTAARTAAAFSWEATASAYLRLCERLARRDYSDPSAVSLCKTL